jgi:hypothetical protein
MNSESVTCGSINEAGLLNSFFRGGFNVYFCLAELIANSIDAGATKFSYIIDDDYVIMKDNGKGISKKRAPKMFEMFRENHKNDNSIGVSGIGGKAAMANLSKIGNDYNNVFIYTKYKGKGATITFPFRDMKREQKYTNMCKYDSTETKDLKRYLSKYLKQEKSGTVIVFKSSDELLDAIRIQLNVNHELSDGDKRSLLNNERLAIFFGLTNIDIELIDNKETYKLPKYNYFKGQKKDFYIRNKYQISICFDESTNDYRFIAYNNDEDNYYEQIIGKNCSRRKLNDNDLKKINFHSENNNNRVDLELRIGIRKDKEIFDEKKPFDVKNKTDENKDKHSAENKMVSYDSTFFKSSDLAAKCCGLIRNNLYISDIRIDSRKRSNARAGFKELIKNNLLKWSLEYTTDSPQDNFIDKCLGIQQNKNQHNGEIPDKLRKLIEYFYDKTNKDLIEKLSEIYEKYREEQDDENEETDYEEEITDEEVTDESNKEDVNKEIEVNDDTPIQNGSVATIAPIYNNTNEKKQQESESKDDDVVIELTIRNDIPIEESKEEEIKEPITHEEEMPALESPDDIIEMKEFIKYIKENKSKHIIKEYIKNFERLLAD